jgi:hypothetical protein
MLYGHGIRHEHVRSFVCSFGSCSWGNSLSYHYYGSRTSSWSQVLLNFSWFSSSSPAAAAEPHVVAFIVAVVSDIQARNYGVTDNSSGGNECAPH